LITVSHQFALDTFACSTQFNCLVDHVAARTNVLSSLQQKLPNPATTTPNKRMLKTRPNRTEQNMAAVWRGFSRLNLHLNCNAQVKATEATVAVPSLPSPAQYKAVSAVERFPRRTGTQIQRGNKPNTSEYLECRKESTFSAHCAS